MAGAEADGEGINWQELTYSVVPRELERLLSESFDWELLVTSRELDSLRSIIFSIPDTSDLERLIGIVCRQLIKFEFNAQSQRHLVLGTLENSGTAHLVVPLILALDKLAIDCDIRWGLTPLQIAVMYRSWRAVRDLLANHADIYVTKLGVTLLQAALKDILTYEIAALLLIDGAALLPQPVLLTASQDTWSVIAAAVNRHKARVLTFSDEWVSSPHMSDSDLSGPHMRDLVINNEEALRQHLFPDGVEVSIFNPAWYQPYLDVMRQLHNFVRHFDGVAEQRVNCAKARAWLSRMYNDSRVPLKVRAALVAGGISDEVRGEAMRYIPASVAFFTCVAKNRVVVSVPPEKKQEMCSVM